MGTHAPIEPFTAAMHLAFTKAKRCFFLLLIVQSTVGVAGLVGVFWPPLAAFISCPVFVIILAVVTLLLQMMTIRFSDSAESMKRMHERHTNFGIPPAGIQFAEAVRSFGMQLTAKQQQDLDEGREVSSTQPMGDRRAMENLRESSFHSSDQSKFVAKVLFCGAGLLALLAVIVLVTYLPKASAGSGQLAAESVSAFISLFVSSNLLTSAWQYWKMGASAAQATSGAIALLAQPGVNRDEASALWQEYQLARATSPPVPTFVWRLRRKKNNASYALLLARETSRPSSD
jgi:ABC-type multidrug transport system fused ATPase/permease subunit